MNTSIHFHEGGKSAVCRALGDVSSAVCIEFVSEVAVTQAVKLGTVRPGNPRVGQESEQRVPIDRGGTDDQGHPPATAYIACSDDGPRSVRFLDGPDSPLRTRQLHACVFDLTAGRCHELLMLRGQKALASQLQQTAIWASGLRAQLPGRPVLLAINGVDQRLTFPVSIARELTTLANIGVSIVCTVDGRYGDARMLTFDLRTLWVSVLAESLHSFLGKRSGLIRRTFPVVDTPALAAYRSRNCDLRCTKSGAADDELPDRDSERPGVEKNLSRRAGEESTSAEFARAYRNYFAINRLMRERLNSRSRADWRIGGLPESTI
jgi:hypothetical protein